MTVERQHPLRGSARVATAPEGVVLVLPGSTVPVDLTSLLALSELGARAETPEPDAVRRRLGALSSAAAAGRPDLDAVRRRLVALGSAGASGLPELTDGRRRLLALGAASMVAGIIAGTAVPVASAETLPAGAATTAPADLGSSAAALLAHAAGPDWTEGAAPPVPAAAAARETGTTPTARPAASAPAAAHPASPATVHPPSTRLDGSGASSSAPRAVAPEARPDDPRPTTPAGASAPALPPQVAPTTTTGPSVTAPSAGAAVTAPTGAAAAGVPGRPLPAGSGSGRRIVYAERAAHLWVVDADGTLLRDYAVTGRVGRPVAGTYHVYSKSPTSVNTIAKVRFDLMVRFAHGITGAPIGFHTIPVWYDGRPLQTEAQLGSAIGRGGCVRQAREDAEWLYAWSKVGDTVVVLR